MFTFVQQKLNLLADGNTKQLRWLCLRVHFYPKSNVRSASITKKIASFFFRSWVFSLNFSDHKFLDYSEVCSGPYQGYQDYSEVYQDPSVVGTTELFYKNTFKRLLFLQKSFIVDVWHGPKYINALVKKFSKYARNVARAPANIKDEEICNNMSP